MASKLATAFVDNRSRPRAVRCPRCHKRRIVVVRDEADLLAVWLVSHREPTRPGVVAHGVLRAIADRKARLRELILRQREEEVRLILGAIDAAFQEEASGGLVADHTRVVPGGHIV